MNELEKTNLKYTSLKTINENPQQNIKNKNNIKIKIKNKKKRKKVFINALTFGKDKTLKSNYIETNQQNI